MKPLLITDCDEVLLHMVRHFGVWLDEEHAIDFAPDGGRFENAMRRRADGRTLENEEMWGLLNTFFPAEMDRQTLVPHAREALAALGVTDVPMIGVAKGPYRDAGNETFYLADKPAVKLPPRDPLLYFIQRLRDEAHRFAIGSHRTRRKKDIREAGLQEIPGIGPTRKRALLHHFGTLKAIERASLSDLAQVPGINDETARKIHDFFHESAAR